MKERDLSVSLVLYKLMFHQFCFYLFPQQKILSAPKPSRTYFVHIGLLLSFLFHCQCRIQLFMEEIIIYPPASCLESFMAIASYPIIFIFISFCFFGKFLFCYFSRIFVKSLSKYLCSDCHLKLEIKITC